MALQKVMEQGRNVCDVLAIYYMLNGFVPYDAISS